MSKKLLLIVNPNAGKKRSQRGLYDIVDTLCRCDCEVNVRVTAKRGDAVALAQTYAQDYDEIVCVGGDGTLNEVINGVMLSKSSVPIGYIPAGSTNDFASTMHIPLKLREAAAAAAYGYPHPHDIGQFNGRFFTYIASLGAFTKVSYSTPQKLKNALGHAAYILEGAKDIGGITPFSLSFTAEEQAGEGEFLFGSVSNSTSVGGFFRLDPLDVRLDDGQFEVMLIRNPQNPSLSIPYMLRCLLRQEYDPEFFFFFHTADIRFSSSKPLDWTLDGECGGAQTEVHIQTIPNAVQIVRR